VISGKVGHFGTGETAGIGDAVLWFFLNAKTFAIMRLGSRSVLNTTSKLLGLEDMAPSDMLARCLQLSTGRALLLGRWTKGEPEFIYTAMRRTAEGGRNLREKHWARPIEPDKTPTEAAKNATEASLDSTSRRSKLSSSNSAVPASTQKPNEGAERDGSANAEALRGQATATACGNRICGRF
jgi:hypothetical protein